MPRQQIVNFDTSQVVWRHLWSELKPQASLLLSLKVVGQRKSKSKANERARGAAVAQCPDSRGEALRKDVVPEEPDRPCFIEDKVKKF